MNHIFNRVVVLLNDLEKIEILLKRAMAFSASHETTLEILYVHETPLFAVPDIFLNNEKRSENRLDKAKVKEEIERKLISLEFTKGCAILVYIDDTVDRLLNHAKEPKETLVLTNYHETITPQLIEKCGHAFWINKSHKESYGQMVMPIDLTGESKACILSVQHIFPKTTLALVYDYRYLLDVLAVREDYLNVVPVATSIDYGLNQELEIKSRERFEAYKKEFAVDGYFMEGGGPLHEDLMAYIEREAFDLTTLYHNNEELFFSPTLIVTLLKGLSTDFFICKH
jgi:hypothetical protein